MQLYVEYRYLIKSILSVSDALDCWVGDVAAPGAWVEPHRLVRGELLLLPAHRGVHQHHLQRALPRDAALPHAAAQRLHQTLRTRSVRRRLIHSVSS